MVPYLVIILVPAFYVLVAGKKKRHVLFELVTLDQDNVLRLSLVP